MNPTLLPHLIFTSDKGWPELLDRHPSITKLFLTLVLPLSALPPLMLHWHGAHYSAVALGETFARPWDLLATIFFLSEMLSYAAMGWLIGVIGANYNVTIRPYDAYLLAAVSPVPMWLSSLALFVPNLPFTLGCACVGLCLSCAILYNGIRGLCQLREEIVAAGITYAVLSAGFLAWLLLTLLIVVPL